MVLLLSLTVSVLLVAGAIVWAGARVAGAIQSARADAKGDRALRLLDLFAAGMAAAERDPRVLLVWQPLARSARALFAEECASLDRATGGRFPFSESRIEAAHARWTAEWLAWEGTHDAEYKLKAAAVEQEISTSGTSALARARLDVIEREKLDLYQRRYEEYIRVAKALHALSG